MILCVVINAVFFKNVTTITNCWELQINDPRMYIIN